MAQAPQPMDVRILAAHVESGLPPQYAVQKAMFGGFTFMHRGNMLCCATKKGLMLRVGAAAEAEALAAPFARPCDGAGRRMTGFVMVEAEGLAAAADLDRWLARARAYVETLPAKRAVR